jgi:carbamoyl-phosphate synthase large subunit
MSRKTNETANRVSAPFHDEARQPQPGGSGSVGASAVPFNILLTCAGQRVELVEAFQSALRELGLDGRVIVADMSCAVPAGYVADECVRVCATTEAEYIDELLEAVDRYHIRLIVPVTDWDLLLLAEQRQRFYTTGAAVVAVGSSEIVNQCLDKLTIGDTVPGIVDTRPAHLGSVPNDFYPCIVKPRYGSGGKAVIRLDSLDAHTEWAQSRNTGAYVAQRYISGREFTVDCYRDRQGKTRCIAPRQRLVVRSGEVQTSVTVDHPELFKASQAISEALQGLWGAFNLQFRWPEDGEPVCFEVNPRFGGGSPLTIKAGADFPRYLIEDVLGLPLTVGEIIPNLLMMRYDEAVYLNVSDLTALPGYGTPRFK